MKKGILRTFLLATLSIALVTGITSCGVKDADVKAAVETALQANPDMKGLTVEVKDGVVTLGGECKDDACKAKCEELAKAVKGVKSVDNKTTVTPPPPPPTVVVTADDPLVKGVTDATKDFPGVTATVKDGVITVTGEITAAHWKKLKMALDGLKPKKVDGSGLKIK